jgi:hypothetical protein
MNFFYRMALPYAIDFALSGHLPVISCCLIFKGASKNKGYLYVVQQAL